MEALTHSSADRLYQDLDLLQTCVRRMQPPPSPPTTYPPITSVQLARRYFPEEILLGTTMQIRRE